VKVVGVFPDKSHDPIIYPVAATVNAKPETMRYLAFLRSAATKAIFEGYGISLIMNDRWDLGNKAGAALESYIAPQPSDRDNETIPKANQKIDVHCAPKHPTNETFELNRTELYDSGAATDGC